MVLMVLMVLIVLELLMVLELLELLTALIGAVRNLSVLSGGMNNLLMFIRFFKINIPF